MTTAVADVLAEPANAAENDDLADDDTAAAAKAGTLPAGSKTLVAADATSLKSSGEGDIAELQPILKPGTQLAALDGAPAPVSKKLVRQTAVDDQTTTNVWKAEGSGYGIQVGAYAQYKGAQRAATHATKSLPKLLADARIVIDPQKSASTTLYRARVVGLTKDDAETACKQLKDCLVLKNDSSLAMGTN
jgi:D-alanyl-D-alanine carboxypeptidase